MVVSFNLEDTESEESQNREGNQDDRDSEEEVDAVNVETLKSWCDIELKEITMILDWIGFEKEEARKSIIK